MFNKLLVPLDGSKLSECSLERVKDIASGCNVTEVILLTVIEKPMVYMEYSGRQQIEEQIQKQERENELARSNAEGYLEKASGILKANGITSRIIVIQAGNDLSAADVILDYAENNNIDLIIMSSHGRSGVTRWAFGSIAERVVRHSRVPVLTVVPNGCRMETSRV